MEAGIDGGDLEVALRLADVADEISMALFRDSERAFNRKDGSPVTEADLRIESRLRELLGRDLPADSIYGEEFGGERGGQRVWLVDPIDGTGSFVEGGTEWATLIAFIEGGRPAVGVVSSPATRTRWWAARGLGAYRNGSRIRVSATPALADAVMQEDFRVSCGRRLPWNPVAAVGAACRAIRPWADRWYFAAIAGGEADFAINWWAGNGPDLASQVCIVEEAGGRFSDLDGSLDIDADMHVVSNGALHDAVVHRVREVIRADGLDPSAEPDEDIAAIWNARARQPTAPWQMHP